MTSSTSFRQLIALAILAILLMSFVPLIIRWTNANEVSIGIVRLAIGALGLAIIQVFSKSAIKLTRQDWAWLVALGTIFGVHWLSYFHSIKLAGASLAAIGVATFGIHLLILNAIFLKQRLTFIDAAAVALSIIGILLASPPFDLNPESWTGFLIAILSGLLYAFLPLINRNITHLTTNTRALGQFGFGLVFFLFLLPQANFELQVNDWYGLIFLGLFSTLIAHTLWLKVSTELAPQITAVIYYAYIPVALVLSYWFLNEALTWQKVSGALLIILANVLAAVFHQQSITRATALKAEESTPIGKQN
ncbi:DMT family transporter [Aliikangiella sp. IMCC44653]